MNAKEEILTRLTDELTHWEELLSTLSEDQIMKWPAPPELSIKDVIAHLMAWQQLSIARLEAARLGREPQFPAWVGDGDPDVENVDTFNATIQNTYRRWPWSRVHQAWRDGYLRFLELGQALDEKDLLETGKYHWLPGYALMAVLQGSYEHHLEHMESLRAQMKR